MSQTSTVFPTMDVAFNPVMDLPEVTDTPAEPLTASSPIGEDRPTLALRLLHVGSYNPRRFVKEDEAFQEFCDSVAALGVFSPIIVRRVEGKKTPYEIVAGQRRFLAALRVHGLDYHIPVDIRLLTDEQALAIATAENIEREDMSPVEEAEAAAKMVAKCSGSQDEACKRLGWKPHKLRERLKLMACSQSVRDAIVKEEIPVGLGELLAGLKTAQQDEMLADFKMTGVPTIEVARARIMQTTRAFSGAIFDVADCASCPHNSAIQRSMFGSLEEGHCLNGECFTAKTTEALQAKADALKETYQEVRIVYPGDKYLLAPIKAEQIGEQEAESCRSCKNFGAAVSGAPDKLGRVAAKLCWNPGCYQEKTTAHSASVQTQAAAKEPVAPQNAADAKTTHPVVKEPSSKTPAVKTEPVKAVELGKGIEEFRTQFFRGVMVRVLKENQSLAMAMLLTLLMSRKGSHFEPDDLLKVSASHGLIFERGSQIGDTFASITQADPAALQKALPYLAMAAVGRFTLEELKSTLTQINPEMGNYFALNDAVGTAFLNVLTKVQIDVVCRELGIDVKMGKTYASLLNGKKDDLIKHITSVAGFDYAGKVPKVLRPDYEA